MTEAALYAVIASSALPLGAWIGLRSRPSKRVTAALLAFASGALITAVAFELFDAAFRHGGAWRAGSAFFLGASAFIAADVWLERHTDRRRTTRSALGFALLAAVTLDGLPENVAMGVSLVEGSGAALLVAIFVSNLPEATVGAQKMLGGGLSEGRIMLIWSGTALALTIAVLIGYEAFSGLDKTALAFPLGFAAGAVLASLADTLMPEAFAEAKGNPHIAYFTALGFLLSFLVSSA